MRRKRKRKNNLFVLGVKKQKLLRELWQNNQVDEIYTINTLLEAVKDSEINTLPKV
jgi:hypothetical protein